MAMDLMSPCERPHWFGFLPVAHRPGADGGRIFKATWRCRTRRRIDLGLVGTLPGVIALRVLAHSEPVEVRKDRALDLQGQPEDHAQ